MPLIITGHERSGTTLLRNLCNAHPDMTLTMEFGNFLELGKSLKEYTAFIRKQQKSNRHRSFLVQGAREQLWFEKFKSRRFVRRYLKKLTELNSDVVDVEAIDASLKSIFSQASIVGDKLPHYIRRLDKLVGQPSLIIIVIYRDCRDVVSSTLQMVRTHWSQREFIKDINSAEKVAKRWVSAVEQMEKYQEELRIIRYEEMISNPAQAIERLSKFLKINAEGFPKEMIENRGVKKYLKLLTREELDSIDEIAGEYLARYKYL
jgi:hypothetical protein